MKVMEFLYFSFYIWQTKIMKEGGIPFLATIISLSGFFVILYIDIIMFLIKIKFFESDVIDNKNLHYGLITLILIGNYLLFKNIKYQQNIIKKFNTVKGNFYIKFVWIFTLMLCIIFLTIPIWYSKY